MSDTKYPPHILAAANKVKAAICPIDGSGNEIADALLAEMERCSRCCDALMRETIKMRYALEIDQYDRGNVSGILEACVEIGHRIKRGEDKP